jgi:hypothetical protein
MKMYESIEALSNVNAPVLYMDTGNIQWSI